MSKDLTSNEIRFIQLMAESPEQAKWGFETLLKKRKDFSTFFDHLQNAGLFDPENNIGPVDSKKPGYVRIPYWSVLDYLEAVAKQSGETNDLELAGKVMDVIRSVSHYCDQNGQYIDNYQTYRKFAKFIGLLPTDSVALEDIDLIPIWLGSEYDRGLVSQALNIGALKRFFESDNEDDWQKAIRILLYCTEIKYEDDPDRGIGKKKPISVVDKYWLEKLIKNNANNFGVKAPLDAAQILEDRIQKVFVGQSGDNPSYLSRPAVEEHTQNYSFYHLHNCLVEGFRDVLLSWSEWSPEETAVYLKDLLENDNEMAQRVAIYVIDERWQSFNSLYNKILKQHFFDFRFLHEFYNLLKNHFAEISSELRETTVEIISNIPFHQDVEEPETVVKYRQRNWLSALAGQGFDDIDSWYDELNNDTNLGPLSKHPDFYFYMESWDGFGDSRYSTSEIITFAELGTLIDRLNSYQQPNTIRGTSTMSLVRQLEEAVTNRPKLFLKIMPGFIGAKRPYQYGLIEGYKKLWDKNNDSQSELDWDTIWSKLLDFFALLINDEGFWSEEVEESRDFVPTRDWIPPKISEFIEAGTKKDETAYTSDLLPKTFELIKTLLEKSDAIESPGDDPMSSSINSPKGKAIEAFFSYTLRACRVNDQTSGQHEDTWNALRATFDNEIEQCRNSNFEFSTLAAAYLGNLEYINSEWLTEKIHDIFPKAFKDNFHCAIDGLAYSTGKRSIYKLLSENNLIELALKSIEIKKSSRERLVERISLAYLWGDESLDSEIFGYIFENQKLEDLKIASHFFWSIRNQKLSDEQVESIKQFWHECIHLASSLDEKPAEFLSELSRLSCFITTLSETDQTLLLSVSPYIGSDFNGDYFIENITRLLEQGQDAEKICDILDLTFQSYEPDYDYKDLLKNLMNLLAEKGKIEKALIYTDKLRRLDGFDKLYRDLQKA